MNAHWNGVYATNAPSAVSWFQIEPTISLKLLRQWASPRRAFIDVGAGASTLVDRLLRDQWADLTVLDTSATALDIVHRRIGDAPGVSLTVADVLRWEPNRSYHAWHDRAVFHFLVEVDHRSHYVSLATRWLSPGGVLIMATFAPDGPDHCSGLPTARYDATDLAAVFGPGFDLVHTEREEHVTPGGGVQPFTWVVLRRNESAVA